MNANFSHTTIASRSPRRDEYSEDLEDGFGDDEEEEEVSISVSSDDDEDVDEAEEAEKKLVHPDISTSEHPETRLEARAGQACLS